MVSDTLATLLIGAYLGAAGDHAALYQGQIEPPFVQAIWTKHPYWDDTEFHTGTICFGGTLYYAVPLRYNILDNRLAVITTDGKLVVVPDQQRIDWFEVEGERFVRANGCFMRVEQTYEGATLLLSRSKKPAGEVVQDRYVYKDMMTEERYYLQLADGSLHKLRRLRSLQKTLNKLLGKAAPVAPIPPYSLSPLGSTAYDSLLAQVADIEHIPAYEAYKPGGTMTQPYVDYDQESATPGVTPWSPLREARTLQEVEVLGLHSKVAQGLGGMESFRPALLRNIPLVMGEADVLKLAMKLPGVSSTGEASSGINVRGSATEQTLMLYNGNTIFNPMHMFGLFSAFDPDLVAESQLYKGSLPSQYGGRLSSVLNIKGRTPDRQTFHGSASLGLVTSRAVVEVPIVRDRVSLLLGGRATYSDWMLKLMPKKEENGTIDSWYIGSSSSYNPSQYDTRSYRDGKANYWDLGGTLNAQLTHDHTLLLNGYYSHDRFALTQNNQYAYANMNFSAELRSHYDDRLSTVITAGYDHYDYQNDDTKYHNAASRLSFDLNQYFLKAMGDYRLNDDHKLNLGVQGQFYHILPGKYEPLGADSKITSRSLTTDNAVESALWLEDEWRLRPDLTLTGGLRLNLFVAGKEGKERTYAAPDLRLSANYMIDDNSSVKAGLSTTHQFIHKVSNTVIMSPTDTWILSNADIRPQRGWQLSAGYYWQPNKGDYELSAEAYYKGMNHYLTYRGAAILVMNDELEREVVGTEGRAYGLELQLRKLYGRLNGWLSYTYSHTQLRQRPDGQQSPINHGHWFWADYDSPHDVKLVCNFKFTRRYSTSLNVDYSTGRPFTAPIAIMPSETTGRYTVPVYSERNACRMPDYCRADWSFNIEPSHHLTNRTHSWLTIGVYNLLGRRNAYSIYFEGEQTWVRGYKMSIFGAPIPYVNYNIKF